MHGAFMGRGCEIKDYRVAPDNDSGLVMPDNDSDAALKYTRALRQKNKAARTAALRILSVISKK